jgi:hypothetical protein
LITEIDVRGMLSRTGLPHGDLITRPTGRAVRSSIEAELGDGGADGDGAVTDVVVLNFTDIRLMDCSCADEVLARLVLASPRVFLVRGLAEHHVDPVEQVLERQQLALVVEQDGALALLGPVAERARAAFRRLAERGAAKADELAAELAWPLEEVAAALDDLAGRRLILSVQGRYQTPHV